jgi:glycosyltransferase involved in cell wall biosynthesis
MSKLTVIIPTYNEKDYIEDAIKSVEFADEIIVIDSFSTDDTKQIALAAGCKVIERKFDTFSNQKNHAISYASSDWILFLDADERVSQKLRIEIVKAITNSNFAGYKIKFPHYYFNRFLYQKVDKVIRLVKNDAIRFTGDVHEKLIIEGKVGVLKNFMIHYTYKNLFHWIHKKDSYAWFQAKESVAKDKKVTFLHLIVKPMYRFFSYYILKQGFKDGIPGLALASVNAYGVFSRYVKMLLIKKGLE